MRGQRPTNSTTVPLMRGAAREAASKLSAGEPSPAEAASIAPMQVPPALTVPQAGHLLGLSRSAAYRAAEKGEIPTIRFGRRLFVPTIELMEMLGWSRHDLSISPTLSGTRFVPEIRYPQAASS